MNNSESPSSYIFIYNNATNKNKKNKKTLICRLLCYIEADNLHP